ncbi:MAG: FIST C-terminal domain-containing protein [Myxococcales bacterium]|nr:FIST C-terminal domain-containing protein [Myxococcales bacterium]
MIWGSGISLQSDSQAAVSEASEAIRRELASQPADLVVIFVSGSHAERASEVACMVAAEFPTALLFGCTAASVIGAGREMEEGAAVALAAARLPDVSLSPFAISGPELHALGSDTDAWRARVGVENCNDPGLLLLGDPYSGDAEAILRGIAHSYPQSVQVGGLASGGGQPGENQLILGEKVYRDGFIGIAMSGNVVLESVVSQGCRAVGPPMFVTAFRGNQILELDGRRPIDVLEEIAAEGPEADIPLFRGSLFIGIQMDHNKVTVEAGDFLVRNLLGADPVNGGLSIGAELVENQVVQFHLRDGESASNELDERLSKYAKERPAVSGSLLFSCMGRGRGMYGVANHDSDALRRHLGEIPVAGFFGNGEIGPIAGKPYLHGYTSAFGFFRSRN